MAYLELLERGVTRRKWSKCKSSNSDFTDPGFWAWRILQATTLEEAGPCISTYPQQVIDHGEGQEVAFDCWRRSHPAAPWNLEVSGEEYDRLVEWSIYLYNLEAC